MRLGALILKRGLIGLGTMLVVSLLVFLGTEVLPGDVAEAVLGRNATPELVERLREQMGLNQPLSTRYASWLSGFLTGDFGASLVNGVPVAEMVSERGGRTLVLAVATAAVAVPLSVVLGLVAAARPGGTVDNAISASSLFLISLPDFLVAVLLVSLFSVSLGWLPAIASIRPSYDFLDWMRILALPVAALVLTILAHMTRMTRAAVVAVLSTPAIEMAILKGVPRRRLFLRHALPMAVGPIANVVALNLAYLISGVVVIETLFNFQGLGRYMVDGVTNRDIPVVQSCAMLFCMVYIVLNIVADITAIVANPRVRFPR